MPAYHKGTLVFKQKGYGWTETYYRLPGSDNLQTSLNQLSDLAGKRRQLSCVETEITHARVSDTSRRGAALLLPYRDNQMLGTAIGSSDVASTCLLALCRDPSREYRKTIYFRGVPDDWITPGGGVQRNAALTGALSSYLSALRTGAWGWLARTHPTPLRKVAAIGRNPDDTVSITHTETAWPAEVIGTTIEIGVSRVEQPKAINGQLAFVPTGAFVGKSLKRIALATYTTGGTLAWNERLLRLIDTIDIMRSGEHATGRVLFQPAGRSRTRPRF